MTSASELSQAEFEQQFCAALSAEVSPSEAAAHARHAWLVAARNQTMNLTRIVEPRAMAVRHVLDSLAALPIIARRHPGAARILDLGTGAGWPGLALAIARPELRVTLLDATRKKVQFLEEIVRELGLAARVECVWGRCETHLESSRANYDCVVARAVAPIAQLLEWTEGGALQSFVFWKGDALDDELREAAPLLQRLRLEVVERVTYVLPDQPAERFLVVIGRAEKIKNRASHSTA
ncbi:MAG: 16S rRNA (guanine(527)-N(7))-methyltransferase RsmG [Planctomycetota bacterium]